ncbi:hypothetical protein [Rubinisphaera margarita]|uniref:hypothetical protein n=1 Tax=Rubinisphaera margarita TaxID=2909586 RepID=UPI001EE822BF|nr:hypothetical protein [Rubinisphaera margarita]MCG6154622.1 hypothetical protein [Rubinisphaera margarita]
MKERTRHFIERIRQATWFSNVELPVTHEGRFIDDIVVASYGHAFDLFNSQDFEEMCQFMRRPITKGKNKDLGSRLVLEWGDCVNAIRPVVETLVQQKLTQADICPRRMFKSSCDGFNWQIVLGTCCVEFSEFPMPTFYTNWCDILIDGHFACYWDGDTEEGQFVVI